jgi:hypothetical protein
MMVVYINYAMNALENRDIFEDTTPRLLTQN